MTQIELIKAEIERLKEKYRPLVWGEDSEKSKEGGYKIEVLTELMLSLPEEQPSEDLEVAAKEYEDNLGYYKCMNQWPGEAFIAGAQWQKEQMMKEAISCEVVGEKRDLRLINSTERCLFDAERGDWLKIIIVKEDEK